MIQSYAFRFFITPIYIYTHTCNVKKLRVIKYLELNKFHIPASTKLKLIEHFAHRTLVAPKNIPYLWYICGYIAYMSGVLCRTGCVHACMYILTYA